MAATPRFKVHNPTGEYVASCKYLEDAAAVVAMYGDGAYIKDRNTGTICWREGKETMTAAESFDNVRVQAMARISTA